ncbi:Snakin-1 [Ananas comosus]|uniref:Snakin-1 n=1 Tax=Ananas comosus TaxID=4615 RepID=A0A199VRD0_ANACO|nr:Snakin-1 [Ananas comosus]
MKLLYTTLPLLLLLLLLLLASDHFQATMAGSGVRCSKASEQERCLKYCGLCCEECRCVPPGTYGNKDRCPCYRDKFTGHGRRRRPKCP